MSEMEQKRFLFKESLNVAEKKSFADYTKGEIARNEELIREAHANHMNLSPDLLHYVILKSKEGPNK